MAATVFKQRQLEEIPAGAEISGAGEARRATWTDSDGRRRRCPVVSTPRGDRAVVGVSNSYYGKVRVGPGQWKRRKLYSDKTASERRLVELQRQADQRAAGMHTSETDAIARPIVELRKRYIDTLTRERRKAAHVKISAAMLDRLIQLGEWEYFRDITRESVEKILKKIEAEGKKGKTGADGKRVREDVTVSYLNKYIVRAKAFVHHWLPDGWPDPLRKLKRISEKGAKRNRGRRAATAEQLRALLASDLPHYRRVSYALAALNSLRRNEIEALRAEDLHLAATIPHVGLLNKQRGDDKRDVIPLHPYVVRILTDGVAGIIGIGKVVPNVPDVATLAKDWQAVGVAFVDEHGDRLDFHALRHTFASHLDRTGCSRATKKKLMRHAAEDVTDGYTHAELAEMLAALLRLPSPDSPPEAVARTGTDDAPADAGRSAHDRLKALGSGRKLPGPPDQISDQVSGHEPLRLAMIGAAHGARRANTMPRHAASIPAKTKGIGHGRPSLATCGLNKFDAARNVPKTGPDTQVD